MSASESSGSEPWPYAPSDEHGWPSVKDCEGDLTNALCKAKLGIPAS